MAGPCEFRGLINNFTQISIMKKIVLLLIAVGGIGSIGLAQAKKGVQTVTIETPTVQCEVCKKRVEEYLLREPGVQKSVADFKKKKTRVTYVAERTNIENIKTAIANAGFDADDVKANEESYKLLPPCCKRPEDGGGTNKE